MNQPPLQTPTTSPNPNLFKSLSVKPGFLINLVYYHPTSSHDRSHHPSPESSLCPSFNLELSIISCTRICFFALTKAKKLMKICLVKTVSLISDSQMLNVWRIYLYVHLGSFGGKCRQIYRTLSIWDFVDVAFFFLQKKCSESEWCPSWWFQTHSKNMFVKIGFPKFSV